MKVKSVIGKLKKMGIDPEDINVETSPGGRKSYSIQIGKELVTWMENEYAPGDANLLHMRRADDQPDSMTDYFPGTFLQRLNWLEWIKQDDIDAYHAKKAEAANSSSAKELTEGSIEEPSFEVVASAPAIEPIMISPDPIARPVSVTLDRVEGHTSQLATVEIKGGEHGVDVLAQADMILWGWALGIDLGVSKVDVTVHLSNATVRTVNLGIGRLDIGHRGLIQAGFEAQAKYMELMGDDCTKYRQRLEGEGLAVPEIPEIPGISEGSLNQRALL